MADKALAKQRAEDVRDRIYEEGDSVDFEQKPVKNKVFVESFRDKYWKTSGVFLEKNKTNFNRELRDLLSKMQRGEDTTGLRGIYEAITNSKKGRTWLDEYFSIGNAATQTRIVCGMPDGFSQSGKSVNLLSSNTQQDWNGYGKIKGKGNVKLDLEPFSYDNFVNCRKRQCWLCGMPLYWDKTNFPEGEHILQYPMMTCFGAGPVTKLFLVEEREKGGIKQLDEQSNLSGFYSTVSSLIGASRTDQFIDWKRRVRTFSYAWSHAHCNRLKCDKSFIKIGMRNNGDIYYYINYKAVNWFVNSIVYSITNKRPLAGDEGVREGWMQVIKGLKKSKKAQGGKVQKKANAIGFKSIYENIMKQLIPLNHLLNQGFGDIEKNFGPRKINLNNKQNKIRANIYFNYRRLKVYFDEHMSEFYSAETNKEKKSLANKTLLMNFFGSILKKKPKHLKRQKALLNHCFNYENDRDSIGSSRGGGKKDEEEFNSTYSYLPLAELLNDLTGYSKPKGVEYVMDLPTESGKDFDDSMNFGSLLEQIRPSDYDKEDGSIVQEIYNTYINFEGEIKDYSESAMKNFISNMLMKMKFDKYGELLDYLFENIEKNPYIKPGIQNNYPELEVASSLKSSLKKEQESLKQILFNDKKNKKEFDEWFEENNMVSKIPYIYDIEGEVKKLVDANYISPEIANEKYYDYFKDNIVEINDGAQWQLWKINLVKYLQHRTETGEVETFGDDSGETYMKKKPDFSQTYLNNLKIIQYKGLLPRIDNITSSRQKKFMQEKRMERDQKRYAKILENRKKGLPVREGIKFKEGDGIPQNFSDPKYNKKTNKIFGGPQNVRAMQKLNDAMYDAMTPKEQKAVRNLEGLQNTEDNLSPPPAKKQKMGLFNRPREMKKGGKRTKRRHKKKKKRTIRRNKRKKYKRKTRRKKKKKNKKTKKKRKSRKRRRK
tara:strand:- start:3488 stop:6304 length:2817 start_codon:yes stop_codon:yes gene_type:complete